MCCFETEDLLGLCSARKRECAAAIGGAIHGIATDQQAIRHNRLLLNC